jgi:hypothetical protein
MIALDLALRATLHHGFVTNIDRETLRALADEGNETALDRLADLADARADLEELSELLDEGCMHAGHLLTRRAVSEGDLLELQRIADAGYDEAGKELERLLTAPIHTQRGSGT